MDTCVSAFRKDLLRIIEEKNFRSMKALILDYYRKGVTIEEILSTFVEVSKEKSTPGWFHSRITPTMRDALPDLLKVAYEEGYDTDALLTSDLVTDDPLDRLKLYSVIASESKDDNQIVRYLLEAIDSARKINQRGGNMKSYTVFLNAAKDKSEDQLERVVRLVISTLDDSYSITLYNYLDNEEWSWDIAGAIMRNTKSEDVEWIENKLRSDPDEDMEYRRFMILKNMDV